ncbi:hypothetical protein FI615_002220 [Enterococcus faecium]|nr:hypothetical protein [Enterococcus faecium]
MKNKIILLVSMFFCLFCIGIKQNYAEENTEQLSLDEQLRLLLEENQLTFNEEGGLVSNANPANSYISNDVYEKIMQIRTQQEAKQKRFYAKSKGNGVIVVPPEENLNTVYYSRNGGAPEYGWYGKRLVNGRPAFCIQPNVALNVGSNYGFNVSRYDNRKASIAAYYGYYKQPSLVNKFYTEGLMNEIINGGSFTIYSDSSGRTSQAKYNKWKKEVLVKTNTFFTKCSLENKTYTLKLGQTLKIKDSANVLSYYGLTKNTAGITVKQNGNTLELTANRNSKNSGTIEFLYKLDSGYNYAPMIYTHTYLQNCYVSGKFVKDPKDFTINIKVIKDTDVVVEHRDRYNNQLLKTTKEKALIGNKYTGKPINNLKWNGNTYNSVDGKAKTITVKEKGNKIILYYDLLRTVTVSHIDNRTQAKIVPDTKVTKRRGEKYSYSPRNDLKRNGYPYIVCEKSKNKVDGTIQDKNVEIKFYYEAPLIQVDLKRIEIYTAKAQEGLPVKLWLNRVDVYDKNCNNFKTYGISLNVREKDSKKTVKKLEYKLKDVPTNIELKIPKEFLTKDDHKEYEVVIEGLRDNCIVSKASQISALGYTASEKEIEVRASDKTELDYKNVIMTGRDYGKALEVKNETYHLGYSKLKKQKTGYGFEYKLNDTYTNELKKEMTINYTFATDKKLLDSYLPYKTTEKEVVVNLDTTKNEGNGEKRQRVYELPKVFVEDQTGALFTQGQVTSKDSHLKHETVDGGRKFYVPIWADLGDYATTVTSDRKIGIHEISIKVKDSLPVKAYMYGTYESKTIKDDEIVFCPLDSNHPFTAGVPENFTEEDIEWVKSNQ